MRRGPVDSGWAGSLFEEPIEQGKAPWASKPVDTFAGAAFRRHDAVPREEVRCTHSVYSRLNGGVYLGCDMMPCISGLPCIYSRPAEHTSSESASIETPQPAKDHKARTRAEIELGVHPT